MMAISVSPQATPTPEASPERRLLLSVRCMHSTATGPTVIDEATPTHNPLSNISIMSTNILRRV